MASVGFNQYLLIQTETMSRFKSYLYLISDSQLNPGVRPRGFWVMKPECHRRFLHLFFYLFIPLSLLVRSGAALLITTLLVCWFCPSVCLCLNEPIKLQELLLLLLNYFNSHDTLWLLNTESTEHWSHPAAQHQDTHVNHKPVENIQSPEVKGQLRSAEVTLLYF